MLAVGPGQSKNLVIDHDACPYRYPGEQTRSIKAFFIVFAVFGSFFGRRGQNFSASTAEWVQPATAGTQKSAEDPRSCPMGSASGMMALVSDCIGL